MKELNVLDMSEIQGGGRAHRILGLSCGVALGLGFFAAGFLTGGAAWAVGGIIAGPACAAAGAGIAMT